MNYSEDNVFRNIRVGERETELVKTYLDTHDFAKCTRCAIIFDLRKFAKWFTDINNECFDVSRVTTRDIVDFKNRQRSDNGCAVATVNRNLVTLRRFYGWLLEKGIVNSNPAKQVKELKRQQLAPKWIERAMVKKLLREIELRNDVRAKAIFVTLLFTGCRVSDLISLKLSDLLIQDRKGYVTFRIGKGGKQRTVPLPLPARQALNSYLNSRPPIASDLVFVGERGPITDKGVRALCNKYATIIGVKLTPHMFRHTFAHQFLEDNNNDLVALAQILGHENVNTTARYSQRSEAALLEASEKIIF